jgi:hypothetical protein
VSNADPKTDACSGCSARVISTPDSPRRSSTSARAGRRPKLHLALDGLPAFRGLDQNALGQRLVIASSSLHIEHAFDEGKYGHVVAGTR